MGEARAFRCPDKAKTTACERNCSSKRAESGQEKTRESGRQAGGRRWGAPRVRRRRRAAGRLGKRQGAGHRSCRRNRHAADMVGRQFAASGEDVAGGRTASNAPNTSRLPKLSGAGPGWHWGRGPPGKISERRRLSPSARHQMQIPQPHRPASREKEERARSAKTPA